MCLRSLNAFVIFLLLSWWQIAKLQDTNRALDRLTKSKEAALIEAERTIDAAEAKASQVDDLLNRNQELMKQIEICQVLTLIDLLPFESLISFISCGD